ncbi:hypothetical protein CLF_108553 [Clonorchis sinensis]|uniref:Uncharacterized protein n=1 Tax=Clonorchis sinensis TaxID=79923 RepID=G7YRQ4_CLOSI|nr:hypothetical protein CLF_108553 [Clonorchis sinensis]
MRLIPLACFLSENFACISGVYLHKCTAFQWHRDLCKEGFRDCRKRKSGCFQSEISDMNMSDRPFVIYIRCFSRTAILISVLIKCVKQEPRVMERGIVRKTGSKQNDTKIIFTGCTQIIIVAHITSSWHLVLSRTEKYEKQRLMSVAVTQEIKVILENSSSSVKQTIGADVIRDLAVYCTKPKLATLHQVTCIRGSHL